MTNDSSSVNPFGQIADEFVEALRQGKKPSVEEFASRYPQHADEIREMLPALALMEKAKPSEDPGQWQAVMGNNPSWHARQGRGRHSVPDVFDEELKLFPVDTVSWDDAQEFIKKLNEKERGKGYSYRLPTEAEWEYACRNGATTEKECSYHFYFDKPTNDLSSDRANCNGNIPYGDAPKGKFLNRTSRVGAYPPNKLGLCDMHGNVWQWCSDAPVEAPYARVFRGGCFLFGAPNCLASDRSWGVTTLQGTAVGFRLVRVPVR